VHRAAAAQHHRLPVPADVGDHLDAPRRAQQRAPLAFVRKRVVIAHFGHLQFMPQVTGPALPDELQLALVERFVEITADRELACGLL
jgi:hypothetical protein